MAKEEGFDSFAEDYREILTNEVSKMSSLGVEYFCEYKVEAVKKDLKKMPQKILDFGCGDGQSCEFFRKYFPDAEIIGVDVSSESIKVAQEKKIQNSKFFVYDGEKLPFEDDSFDLIFAAGVFHHIDLEKREEILKELNRILINGGNLFVFEHNPINPFTLKVVKDCPFDKGVKLIFSSTLKKIAKNAGFKKNEINYTLFFPRYNFFKKFFCLEKYLKKIPLGAQYYLKATKV